MIAKSKLVNVTITAVLIGIVMSSIPPAHGQDEKIEKVTKGVAEKTQALLKLTGDLPAKLEPGKWAGILEGAQQVKTTVARIKKNREAASAVIQGLSQETGDMRTSLAKIEADFRDLAKQATQEFDGTSQLPPLPAPLLESTKREASQHLAGAEAAKAVAQAYSTSLAAFKEQIAVLERAGPQLDRLALAAGNYEKLARIGEKLEAAQKALAGFAGEINSILDMLAVLNGKVVSAVSEVPTTSGTSSPGKKDLLKKLDLSPSKAPIKKSLLSDPAELYQQGLKLLDEGNNAQAAASFRRAYAMAGPESSVGIQSRRALAHLGLEP